MAAFHTPKTSNWGIVPGVVYMPIRFDRRLARQLCWWERLLAYLEGSPEPRPALRLSRWLRTYG